MREARDGKWTLPGGWADALDSPSTAACREFGEEAGLNVRATKLAVVHDGSQHNNHADSPWHVYKLLFLMEPVDVDAKPRPGLDGETTDADYFALDRLPDLSSGRTSAAQLELLLAHHRDSGRPTDFD